MDFKIALEKQDRLIMRRGNEVLAKGKERVMEWQTNLKELLKNENIEIKE
jgi:hypothetical protein